MTLEDIRGEEIVRVYKQKEIIEQYKGILFNNGFSKDDVYRHLRMYLVNEKFFGENTSLSSLFSVDKDLQINIKMEAVESRINKIYVRKTAIINGAFR